MATHRHRPCTKLLPSTPEPTASFPICKLHGIVTLSFVDPATSSCSEQESQKSGPSQTALAGNPGSCYGPNFADLVGGRGRLDVFAGLELCPTQHASERE